MRLVAENIAEDHIIKFAFDSAEDLIKIDENPLVLDNEKDKRKVDTSKFINWLLPQVSGEGMYYLLLDEVQKLGSFESVLNGFLRKNNIDVYVTGRKYIGTPYKIYFEDVELRNARLSFRQIEGTHIMENIIYNELRYRGYQVYVGTIESREKNADGKEIRIQREIDFIASLGMMRMVI